MVDTAHPAQKDTLQTDLRAAGYWSAVPSFEQASERGLPEVCSIYLVRYSIKARRMVSPRATPSIADRSSTSATNSSGRRTE